MEKTEIKQVLDWTSSKLVRGNPGDFIGSISTDSRHIKPGDFFVPLRGPNFNGHHFIEEAVKRGAAGFVAEEGYSSNRPEKCLILSAADNLIFLHDLARHYLKYINPVVIGITGSVGKTTTKNMLVSILGRKYPIGFTPKNFNNDIGVPKAILDLKLGTKYFIAEIAMRQKGQIRQLSEIIHPDIGVITAVGESHLEFFSSMEEIANTKAEIAEYISEKGGVLFLNHDNQWTPHIKDLVCCRIKEFGGDPSLDYNFRNPKADCRGRFSFDFFYREQKVTSVNMNIAGYHHIYNACAAAGVSHHLGLAPSVIREGLSQASLEHDRMQVMQKGSILIINDCYNANPLSVSFALESLKQIADANQSRSVAVLADMLELGPDSARLHYQMGEKAAQAGIDLLITFGHWSAYFNDGYKGRSVHFESKQDCLDNIGKLLKDGDVVLVKGSRANRMEDIINQI
ncbi:MAG: UDP-N-acetylmuramoyl-tripeptide--D-alanyl-D-alanine ligase [Actinomycetota bacterium]|jgi:UDP-N-acetylmuramoyl-tripeptide--D-alanyl-D-alanine ligase|nr:UDP-N-acetylmuramoyl-tripeptide--D-alanyl-D-alanine ligase [Actinomycetota bacterium]